MARRKNIQLPIKFPVETTWTIFIVRTVDPRGVFRIAIAVVTPCGRNTYEFREVPNLDRNVAYRNAIVSIYESVPWWQRPDVIIVEEEGLFDELNATWELQSVEVRVQRAKKRRTRSERVFKSYSDEHPRYDKRRATFRGS